MPVQGPMRRFERGYHQDPTDNIMAKARELAARHEDGRPTKEEVLRWVGGEAIVCSIEPFVEQQTD